MATKSLILGAFDFADYHNSQTKLDPGDVVFTFSDGVTEAANGTGELFGDDRLLALLASSIDLTAEEIKDRVLAEILSFTRGLPQGDDVTVVALKMKKSDDVRQRSGASAGLRSDGPTWTGQTPKPN